MCTLGLVENGLNKETTKKHATVKLVNFSENSKLIENRKPCDNSEITHLLKIELVLQKRCTLKSGEFCGQCNLKLHIERDLQMHIKIVHAQCTHEVATGGLRFQLLDNTIQSAPAVQQ